MNLAYLVLGGTLLVGTTVDVFWTTLWGEGGAGPVTSRLMKWTWTAFHRASGGRSRVLTAAGPSILVLTLALWLLSVWLGWTLVFASAENAVFDTLDGGRVSWVDLSYFTGYTVFTLGNGDFAPREGVWQIATVLTTASGMLFVTLSVTYLLSVLGAVTQKHAFADSVTGLGTDAGTVVATLWTGAAFEGFDVKFDTFTAQLATLTANHEAYPILHYFHSEQADTDPVVAVAVLDETLTLLRFGVPEDHRPSPALLESARSGVGSYLETLETLGAFDRPADRDPPEPGLETVRDAGIPTVADESFAASLKAPDTAERRRTLLRLVEVGARQWPAPVDEEPRE